MNLYPTIKYEDNPHLLMCDFANNISIFRKNIDEVKSFFRTLVDRGGFGFDSASSVDSIYDKESMSVLDIDYFEDLTRTVAINYESPLVWTMYSFEEFEGWLALIALTFADNINSDWKRPLIIMLGRRFDVQKRLSALYQKIAGENDWAFGPVGHITGELDSDYQEIGEQVTADHVEEWRNKHNTALAAEYFKCVNPDFLTKGIELPSESESPLSSAPNVETLFPTFTRFKNPHTALIRTLDGFLYRFENTNELIAEFETLLDGKNYGFSGLGEIKYSYEAQWMEQEGINQFIDGQCCVVGPAEDDNPQWLMYSKYELEAWLCLVAVNLGKKRIDNREHRFRQLLSARLDMNDRLGALKSKLSGEVEWDYGPVGNSATPDVIENWKKLHSNDLQDDFLGYARLGSIIASHIKKLS